MSHLYLNISGVESTKYMTLYMYQYAIYIVDRLCMATCMCMISEPASLSVSVFVSSLPSRRLPEMTAPT